MQRITERDAKVDRIKAELARLKRLQQTKQQSKAGQK